MPRVTHVKAARKDNPVCSKGESYYWWKFKNCSRSFSLTYPRPSQLTRSVYLGAVYDLQERINDFSPEPGEEGVIEEFRDEIVSEIGEIREQCQESLDNMPEQLQYAPTGELLQERIDACENAEGECDGIEEDAQWQDVRDQQEERTEWEGKEPKRSDFPSAHEFNEAHEDWEVEEPDLDEFEDFDASEMAEAVEGMLV